MLLHDVQLKLRWEVKASERLTSQTGSYLPPNPNLIIWNNAGNKLIASIGQ